MAFSSRNLLGLARMALRAARHLSPGPSRPAPPAPTSRRVPAAAPVQASTSAARSGPGDYQGPLSPVYDPHPDGRPDPGEVVWAWVPYEDDPSQGKDRPVLLIGRHGEKLLALMMTTRDRNNSAETDPDYLDIGSGPWDSRGRPSEVKLDRVLQLDPSAIRRQGAVVDRAVFGKVAARLAARRR
ncbi:type II toxin-antitoxin system PemK/MazF family toxin [Arthrobacter sp. zg-Y916]|uniref:type II toxin-antitoxin system PemK/MazF family toxin n=1 Tax=Arthrobacter sp. zg-Y916 TaxID=2894190 RepID=UPI001E50FA29|nr:type II toxin-antitoxin system PemK/MazF family toxin [Arthrobacter sp. zg-Y916]MCC9193565.1 type II toxin-antitoxin system PemK/MazF family toxin [Arthrobacter sp. zg-Y916]